MDEMKKVKDEEEEEQHPESAGWLIGWHREGGTDNPEKKVDKRGKMRTDDGRSWDSLLEEIDVERDCDGDRGRCFLWLAEDIDSQDFDCKRFCMWENGDA